MLSVICCRPGPQRTGSLPCSSGPVAAVLRGSCWRWLRSGRLQWSVWQQLQPAWLQPAEDSDTGQSRTVLENSYAMPVHHRSRHCLSEATNHLSLSPFALFLAACLLFVKDGCDLLLISFWSAQVLRVSTTVLPHPEAIISQQQASLTLGSWISPP